MFIGKEGGYTLRTFKRMVKRAKSDDPQAFETLMKGSDVKVEKPWEKKTQPKKAVTDENTEGET
jgi:hypothetical protein